MNEQEQKCRVCGCTWDHACKGGCYWVLPDLCSRCVELIEQAEESDFIFHTSEHDGVRVLVIIDLNEGGKSVTNNAETVIKWIASELGSSILQNPIIYRDSDGIYDGIDCSRFDDFTFYSIGRKDETQAVALAANRYITGKE